MFLSGELEDISVQLNQLGPQASLWSRTRVILGKYDEWDSKSFTSGTSSGNQSRSCLGPLVEVDPVELLNPD